MTKPKRKQKVMRMVFEGGEKGRGRGMGGKEGHMRLYVNRTHQGLIRDGES